MSEFNTRQHKDKRMPCVATCKNRTYKCKFDGSCDKWQDYQEIRLLEIEEAKKLKDNRDEIKEYMRNRKQKRAL